MRGFRLPLALLLSVCLGQPALAARPKLVCGQASKCPAGVLSNIRAAADTACPCDAASPKAHAKCWKGVVRNFGKTLGKKGFPKACRREVSNVLGNTSCGRSGYVLCRKKGGSVCTVAKARKCKDVFPTGSGFRSCADACAGMAALPFPSTKELARADLASLAPDPGDGTLHFDAAPASLDGVGVGSVIVAGMSPSSPSGLLRLVLAVQRDGQQLTLRTVQAPIQLAYAKLHVTGSHSTAIGTAGAATSAFSPQVDFGTNKEFSYVLFDGDGDEETKNDQVAIGGTIAGGFDYDFAMDFEWPSLSDLPDAVKNCAKAVADAIFTFPPDIPDCSIATLLPEAIVTFVVQPQFNADANVHGAALIGYEKEFELLSGSEPLPPIGPLIFIAKAELKGDVKGGASGAFSTGVHGSGKFETKVRVSSKHTGTPDYEPPVLIEKDFGANETKVTLEAEAKVGVEASLSLLLFDVTGPYATVEPFAEITADILQAPCWNLHAGLDATLGIKVESPDILGLGSVTLVDWKAPTANALDIPIGGGECSSPPDLDGDPILPGSGPDATHVAMPTYTPWSRTYDGGFEGSNAGTPGNAIVFSELQRTIDGRYVRSGFGVQALTKFDDAGTLTWARQLALDETPVSPLRVRSTTDATLFVVSSAFGAPILLTKVAQSGAVVEAHSYDVPEDLCGVDVTALASDNAGGAWVVGRCSGTPKSFLLHAGASATTFQLIGDVDGLRLNIVEPIGDSDVFLAGSAPEVANDVLYAFRLRPDGTLAYAKRYPGCPDVPDAIPSAAIIGSQGEVTIAGSGGSQHNGMVLRLRPDGTVGFAKFPGFGIGLGSVLILDSLVELPTTGFIAGASSVHLVAGDPDDVPSAGLIGFDSAGNILWQQRYTFGTTGAYSASGHVAVRLADDGGVVTTALLADAADPFGLGGRLWAFKPFVKDGTIDFLPGSVTTTDLGAVELCTQPTEATDASVVVTGQTIPVRAVTVSSTPVSLGVAAQTAN